MKRLGQAHFFCIASRFASAEYSCEYLWQYVAEHNQQNHRCNQKEFQDEACFVIAFGLIGLTLLTFFGVAR